MNNPISSDYIQRPLDAFKMDGKVAVVIGGTGVLCGTLARGLAGAGAKVVVVGRSQEKADAVLSEIAASGGEAEFASCDISQVEVIHQLADDIVNQHGAVDVLINGAGVNSATPFLEIAAEELDQLMSTNFKAVFVACQAFGRHFVPRAEQQGVGASIINVGSASGVKALSRVFTYSATKAAVHNLTANLAREWGKLGIRVNTLVPGFFPAEQNRKILTKQRVSQIMGHTPFDRFGEPQELIGATLLLASDAGSFITGTELIVDGGFSNCTI